jgi:hypothetical protein
MKYIIIILGMIAISCTKENTYSLKTFSSDISSMSEKDQKQIIQFSTYYEQNKNKADSVLGVPVVLVESLKYSEILSKIDNFYMITLRKEDELRESYFQELKNLSINVDTIHLGLDRPIIVYKQNKLKLPFNYHLSSGRGFSKELDNDNAVIISSWLSMKSITFSKTDTDLLYIKYLDKFIIVGEIDDMSSKIFSSMLRSKYPYYMIQFQK